MPESSSSSASAPVAATGRFGRTAPWVGRGLLLVLSPLVFFGLLELGLRGLNIGRETAFFIPDESPGYFRTNPDFTKSFFPEGFDLKPLNYRLRRHKEKDGVRVFVLGESAVFGTPEPGFGLVEQLRAQLRAHFPGREVEVCNLGITAINSHVMTRIVRDAVDFAPDLLVIYAGNNEVVGPYGPGAVALNRMPPRALIRLSLWLRSLRTGQLLLRGLERLGGGGRGRETPEWQGMRTFAEKTVRGDDPRLEEVYANFAANLEEIVHVARAAGIKTVLSTVVANLKDSAPFVSLHRAGMSAAELHDWQTAFADGMLAWRLGAGERALEHLDRARKLDPQYADTHYLLGQIESERGRLAPARAHLIAALQWDALRFRPDPRINATIREIARAAGGAVTLVDAARILGADPDTDAALAGHEWLFEHVHFNWEGNYRMARMLAERCASLWAPGDRGTASWLERADCADALGYTDYGRLASLFAIRDLMRVPPFTNQLTFGEDQNRLGREIEGASTRLGQPGALAAAASRVAAALARDPQNPSLLIRLEEIEFQRGDHGQALRLIDSAIALQPRAPELLVKRATLLRLLRRANEAEMLLLDSWRAYPQFLPTVQALAEIWAESGQFGRGREFFARVLATAPTNRYLRLGYADLLLRSGDRAAAESECRHVLQSDPSDEGALARLTQLLSQTGRQTEALELMRAGYRSQPKNFANNSRLAQYYESVNDAGKAAEFMTAMTASGPTNAALRLRLALRLAELNRREEMEVHLLQAKAAAEWERNDEILRLVDNQLQRVRSQVRPLSGE